MTTDDKIFIVMVLAVALGAGFFAFLTHDYNKSVRETREYLEGRRHDS